MLSLWSQSQHRLWYLETLMCWRLWSKLFLHFSSFHQKVFASYWKCSSSRITEIYLGNRTTWSSKKSRICSYPIIIRIALYERFQSPCKKSSNNFCLWAGSYKSFMVVDFCWMIYCVSNFDCFLDSFLKLDR